MHCLQIRLELVAAAAVPGAPTELSGTVRSLEDDWGAPRLRIDDRLRSATSRGRTLHDRNGDRRLGNITWLQAVRERTIVLTGDPAAVRLMIDGIGASRYATVPRPSVNGPAGFQLARQLK